MNTFQPPSFFTAALVIATAAAPVVAQESGGAPGPGRAQGNLPGTPAPLH